MKTGVTYIGTPLEPNEAIALKDVAKDKRRSKGQQFRIFGVERMKQLGLLPQGPVEITRKPYTRKTRKGVRS